MCRLCPLSSVFGDGVERVGEEAINQTADFFKMSIHGDQFGSLLHGLRRYPDIIRRDGRALAFELFGDSGIAVGGDFPQRDHLHRLLI